MIGTVKWFDDKKGYGFIQTPSVQEDIFVHYSSIQARRGARRTLREGEEVSFNIEHTSNGIRAIDVVREDSPAPSRR